MSSFFNYSKKWIQYQVIVILCSTENFSVTPFLSNICTHTHTHTYIYIYAHEYLFVCLCYNTLTVKILYIKHHPFIFSCLYHSFISNYKIYFSWSNKREMIDGTLPTCHNEFYCAVSGRKSFLMMSLATNGPAKEFFSHCPWSVLPWKNLILHRGHSATFLTSWPVIKEDTRMWHVVLRWMFLTLVLLLFLFCFIWQCFW